MIFDRLVDQAIAGTQLFPGDKVRLLRQKQERGENPPIPKELRPGYLLQFLTEKERQEISEMTSDEIAKRDLRPDLMDHIRLPS